MGLMAPLAAQDIAGSLGSVIPLLPGDTMNFARCLQGPKVIGACAGPCVNPAGLVFQYKKPVAVVEVTCKAGSSQLLGGPGLSKLADMALGTVVQQDCGSMGIQKAGATKPRYYDVHVFRVTDAAYMSSPGGIGALAATKAACPTTVDTVVSPLGLAANYGLIPVYLSELDPTWKTPLPTVDSVANSVVASTVGAIGTAAMEGYCFASGLAATLGFAPPNMVDMCVGGWGLRSPVGGWVNHKNESVAAMITAARAYGRAANLQLVEREIPGLAPDFSFVYPPAHPLLPIGTGLRASGCYSEGTMDPRWYTKEEMLLPTLDPAAILNGLGGALTSTITGVNKGYFVATYWRDTSCCRTACYSYPSPPFF